MRSMLCNSLSWLAAGLLLYLGAIRLAVVAPWPVRLLGLSLLLVLPFALLRQVLAGFGVELDLAWLFLPPLAAGFIPLDSSR